MSLIGAVSEGTLRTADLLRAFAYELDARHGEKTAAAAKARTLAELLDDEGLLSDDGETYAAEYLDEMQAQLDEVSPPYCYFGAAEGDGACFGFWPNLDAIRDDIASGELYSSDSTANAPDGLCAVISDHGNLTLYSVSNGQALEIWACV